MREKEGIIRGIAVAAACIALLALTGCNGSGFNWMPWNTDSGDTETASATCYYDFKDVLVPTELEVVEDDTYIVESSGFKTGVLTLKGRVEKRSLVTFFNKSMTKDGWRRVAIFRAPERSILLFDKGSKWCIINVMDNTFSTAVEIGVVPTAEEAAAGGGGGWISPSQQQKQQDDGNDSQIEESGLLK